MELHRHENNNSNNNQQFQVRTLFVSGLPMDAKPRELYLLFRAYKVSSLNYIYIFGGLCRRLEHKRCQTNNCTNQGVIEDTFHSGEGKKAAHLDHYSHFMIQTPNNIGLCELPAPLNHHELPSLLPFFLPAFFLPGPSYFRPLGQSSNLARRAPFAFTE